MDSLPHDVMQIMLCSSNDEQGTVAGLMALSQVLDNEYADGI